MTVYMVCRTCPRASACVAMAQCGRPETDRTVHVTPYNDGFDAGWRGDELLEEKEYSFMMGYEAGQTAKENVG